MTLSAEARRREIKLASGQLVHALGGIEAAGSLISVSKSQVHRCTSVNDSDNFLNAGDVAELELRAARPFVTAALAKLAGGVFVPLPEALEGGEDLAFRVMDLAVELGHVSERVRQALADQVVHPAEAAAIERELDELIEKAASTRSIVRAMQGKTPLPVSPIRLHPSHAGAKGTGE